MQRQNGQRPYQRRKGSKQRNGYGFVATRSKLVAFLLRPGTILLSVLLLLACSTALNRHYSLDLPNVSAAEAWLRLYDEGKESAVPAAKAGETQVHFMDVGQGDATLISQGGSYALIDAGPAESAEDLLVYLQSLGVETLDLLVMTHAHADHIGAMAEVITQFKVKTILLPAYSRCKVDPTGAAYLRVMNALEASSAVVETARVGATYPLGDGTLTVLSAGVPTDNENNISVCTMFTAGAFRLLGTGDAETPVEDAILASEKDIRATVFQAGHHGANTSNSLAFLQAIQPELVVISCGLGNSYGHPHAETLETYDAVGADYLRTDLCGNIVVRYTKVEGMSIICENDALPQAA